MKKILLYVLAFVIILMIPKSCTIKISEPPVQHVNPQSTVTDDTSQIADERIVLSTQEYIGDNIAEIPYFEYDGEPNSEIESINSSLNQGIQQIYDEFMNTADESEWIEIKSYPFTSPNYLQVVVTYCTYPTYGTDGNIFSINYDRKEKKYIALSDVMERLGLSQESLANEVIGLFDPDQFISEVNTAGFLYREEGSVIQLLLEITAEVSGAEPWRSFYLYEPETGNLSNLDSTCLFDPNEMDQMNPPLSYQETFPGVYSDDQSDTIGYGALDILIDALGDKMQEGMAIVPTGEEEIDGMHYWTFEFGSNTPESFIAEEYYAVTDDGAVFILDAFNNQYIPLSEG